ncbi:MAG: hypothetical protein L0Y61_06965 [Epsilonproteobacteria bacterium]|nr:hypothetical protein [Campylobacterota bacterium]
MVHLYSTRLLENVQVSQLTLKKKSKNHGSISFWKYRHAFVLRMAKKNVFAAWKLAECATQLLNFLNPIFFIFNFIIIIIFFFFDPGGGGGGGP